MFTSLLFYGELTLALAAFYLLPGRWRLAGLLAISCAFYVSLAPRWFWLLAVQALIAYAGGYWLARARTDRVRNLLAGASLLPIVGALVALKLGNALHGLVMPLGVSYYTFKLISYVLEVYWDENEVERQPLNFATYVAFGPQMICGPIARPRQFLRQLPRLQRGIFDSSQFELGLFTILRGLLLKLLIGDRLGLFISVVDAAPQNYTRGVLLTVVLCYMVQLYADFAGYTLIAIGIGRLFGIESPPNFNAPFLARNIQDFWRRWHMSLSSWVADYLFTPLSLALRSWGRAGLVFSLFTAMVVIGIWHGLSGTFLVFGLLQGLFISVSALTLPWRDRVAKRWRIPGLLRRAVAVVSIYAMMTVSQIFWQAPSMAAAVLHFRLLTRNVGNAGLQFSDIRTDVVDPVFICMAIAFYHGAGSPGFGFVGRRVHAVVPNWVVGGVALLVLSALSIEAGSSFIYGQF